MFAEESDVRRRAVFEAFLWDHLARDDPSYELVREIVTAMSTDRSVTRVDQVTERFDIPIRTLQRLFRRYVGVGPKWVLRRYAARRREVLAQGEAPNWRTCRSLGYFDQATSPGVQGTDRPDPAEYATRAEAERQITYR